LIFGLTRSPSLRLRLLLPVASLQLDWRAACFLHPYLVAHVRCALAARCASAVLAVIVSLAWLWVPPFLCLPSAHRDLLLSGVVLRRVSTRWRNRSSWRRRRHNAGAHRRLPTCILLALMPLAPWLLSYYFKCFVLFFRSLVCLVLAGEFVSCHAAAFKGQLLFSCCCCSNYHISQPCWQSQSFRHPLLTVGGAALQTDVHMTVELNLSQQSQPRSDSA
jgi:hypothetical protein